MNDLRQPLHGPGGVLAVHVPEQGPGLSAGLQAREDRMSTASNACLERVGRKNPLHTVERVGTKRLSA